MKTQSLLNGLAAQGVRAKKVGGLVFALDQWEDEKGFIKSFWLKVTELSIFNFNVLLNQKKMKAAKYILIALAVAMAYFFSKWCVKHNHYELLLLNIPLFGIAICGLIEGLADKISAFLDEEN